MNFNVEHDRRRALARNRSVSRSACARSTLHGPLTFLADEERVLFETRQSPIKGLFSHASAVSLSLFPSLAFSVLRTLSLV